MFLKSSYIIKYKKIGSCTKIDKFLHELMQILVEKIERYFFLPHFLVFKIMIFFFMEIFINSNDVVSFLMSINFFMII